MGEARFYTHDVLSSHGIQKDKIPVLIRCFLINDRLLPLTLSAIALYCGLRSQNRVLKQLLLAHFLIGVFEGGPAVLAFVKPMGTYNNLGVIVAWAAVPFVPYLLWMLWNDATQADLNGASDSLGSFARMTTLVLSFGLLYCFIPIKELPLPSHYDYSRKLQELVKVDIKAGKRVLVAHGASFQIRSKSRQVPMDRANSYLELFVACKLEMTGTERRLRAGYYDKIYLNTQMFLQPQIHAAILENYREIARIPAPLYQNSSPVPAALDTGFQHLHVETPVYERRERPRIAMGAQPSS